MKKDLLMGLLITLGLIVLSEISLKIYWKVKFPRPPECHIDTGWKYEPGDYGRYKINSYGFRGNEFKQDKGDKFRIVCCGESTTFGYGSSCFSDYPNLLGKLINNKNVEVLNAGVPANTAWQTLNKIKKEVMYLSPDLIILWVGWNDLCEQNPEIYEKKYGKVFMKVRDVSYIVRVLGGIAHKIIIPSEIDRKMKSDKDYARNREAMYQTYTPPDYYKNINEIIKLCKQNQVEIVILNLAGLCLQKGVDKYDSRIHLPYYTKNYDLYVTLVKRYNELIRQIADTNKITMIDVATPISQLTYLNPTFTSHCHFGDEGYKEVARIVYRNLIVNGLIS